MSTTWVTLILQISQNSTNQNVFFTFTSVLQKEVQFQGFIEYERYFFLVMIIIGNNNTKIYSQYQITWTLPHSDGSGLWHWCSRTGVMCRGDPQQYKYDEPYHEAMRKSWQRSRRELMICEQQCGFTSRKSTKDAKFALKSVDIENIEKFRRSWTLSLWI